MAKLRYRSISKRMVEALEVEQDTIFWDRELSGFGVRAYASGKKVYIVQARAKGKSRRVTIGRHGVLTAEQARQRAAQTITRIKAGEDLSPSNPEAPRPEGPTIAALAERYLTEHVAVRCKPKTVELCRLLLKNHIVPELGHVPIEALERKQVADIHFRLRDRPATANHVVAVLSRMFNRAEAWELVPEGTNPCRSFPKYKARKHERFLTEEEFRRLGRVLAEAAKEGGASRYAVAALRLLMLTGCRRSEILRLRWTDVDLEAKVLHLADSKTGPRALPLSPAAARVLTDLPRVADNPWVIVSRKRGTHLHNLSQPWDIIRRRAGLEDVRLHDLRHSWASRALALGESLPMIGRLLGHTQVETTARYAHLARDSVKESAAKVAASIGADLYRHRGKDGGHLHLTGS